MEFMDLSQKVPIQNIFSMGISGMLIVFFPFYVYRQLIKRAAVKASLLAFGGLVYILAGLLLPELLGITISVLTEAAGVFSRPVPFFLYVLLSAFLFDGAAFYFIVRICQKSGGTVFHVMTWALGYGGLRALMIPGFTILSNLTIATGINSVGLAEITATMDADEIAALPELLAPLLRSNPLPMLIIGWGQIASILLYLALGALLFKALVTDFDKSLLAAAAGLLLWFHIPSALSSAGFVGGDTILFGLTAAAAAWGVYLVIKLFPEWKRSVKI